MRKKSLKKQRYPQCIFSMHYRKHSQKFDTLLEILGLDPWFLYAPLMSCYPIYSLQTGQENWHTHCYMKIQKILMGWIRVLIFILFLCPNILYFLWTVYLTLKTPAKIIAYYRNSVDPDQNAHRSRLIWIYTVCHGSFKNISADNISRLLVVIGVLRVYKREFSVFFDFSLSVKAAPHECVIRTSQP